MKALFKKIKKEEGLRLSEEVKELGVPKDYLLFQDQIHRNTDSSKELSMARKLVKNHPDHYLSHHALASVLLMNDQRAEALEVGRKAADEFPNESIIVSLFLSLQESPATTVAESYRLGVPPDLRQFRAQADGTYSIRDYCIFQLTALSVDIATGNDASMRQRMERLLAFHTPIEAVLEKISYYFDQLVQAEVKQGKVMPEQWVGPPDDRTTPMATELIEEGWEEFKEIFMDDVMNELHGSLPEDEYESLLGFFSDGEASPPELKRAVSVSSRKKPKRKKKSGEIYQVKVSLEGIRPPIWRRLLVPADIELNELHEVLQEAFGWLGYHLHQFEHQREYFAPPNPYDFDDSYAIDYAGYQLDDFLKVPKDRLRYEYDFGDSWHHLIVLEKILPVEPKKVYPCCVKGKRSRPPEDVGGVWGYTNFLKIIRDPKHEEHEEMLEWVGKGFDPEAFDLKKINSSW